MDGGPVLCLALVGADAALQAATLIGMLIGMLVGMLIAMLVGILLWCCPMGHECTEPIWEVEFYTALPALCPREYVSIIFFTFSFFFLFFKKKLFSG